jgi:hypothetical protein
LAFTASKVWPANDGAAAIDKDAAMTRDLNNID